MTQCFLDKDRVCNESCSAYGPLDPPDECSVLWALVEIAENLESIAANTAKPQNKTKFPKSARPPEVKT